MNTQVEILKSGLLRVSPPNQQPKVILNREQARALRDKLTEALTTFEMVEPALWVWNWAEGGYNQTLACNEEEARRHADKIWPGHEVINLRRLNAQEAKQYWAHIALWD